MALQEKQIKELEKMLIAEKSKLEGELKRMSNPSSEDNGYEVAYDDIGSDRDDNATEVEEYVDNVAIENSLEDQLKDVDNALEKIKNNKYGICDECGEEISLERLMVNPSAKRCMKCYNK